ncbi:hypothetical protein NSK_004462 [Nannochloropsis salina CCMP1776]|uniref:MMS19 nucleotide excision repair protein n=1 Tax=Nannochloropsis salina CCMP1776 TaxID=1027361 RepID=A0A4D9D2B6_9STRA|nr:hypothetical protein NSK_004462 [Nannochloropsis salina CCMP1776]|eukprot:TFJ84477.1 hypothetical protein NSK_004462 [Nannochloropsis salina CCMP1776]
MASLTFNSTVDGGGYESTKENIKEASSPPFPTSSSFAEALSSYCNAVDAAAAGNGEGEAVPSNITSPDATVAHLNTILLHVQRSKRFEDLVAEMGPYLTNEAASVRTLSATLLGEVLNRLPSLPLTDAAVHHYVEFFSSRLEDFPSVAGSLLGIRALLQHHKEPSQKEAGIIARGLFKHLYVPSMTQTIRQRTFEVVFEMIGALNGAEDTEGEGNATTSGAAVPASLLDMQDEFVTGVIECIEGEKDPRCLILCLNIISRMQVIFPAASDAHIEALFDITACYFPITFTPPPNDPYGITPDVLSHALREALTRRPSMAEFLLPLLVDKLTSTHVPAKLEALLTLQVATRTIGMRAMLGNLASVTGALFQEIVSCAEAPVVAAALETCRSLAAHLSCLEDAGGGTTGGKSRSKAYANPRESKEGEGSGRSEKAGAGDGGRAQDKGGDRADTEMEKAWQTFLVNIVGKAASEVKANPDSMKGRACARVLGAVARASARAYAAVLKAIVPGALQLATEGKKAKPGRMVVEGEGERQEAALLLLVDLVEAVDPDLDFTASAHGPPLAPYVPLLHGRFLACLNSPASGPALLAVKGLASLATRSPSQLLTSAQASELVVLFTHRIQAEERSVGPAYDRNLDQALLEALKVLSARRQELRAILVEHTVPELLKWLDEAAAGRGVSASTAHGKENGNGRADLDSNDVGQSSRRSRKEGVSAGRTDDSTLANKGYCNVECGINSLELDRCLGALAFLADQTEIFEAVVPSLLARVLVAQNMSDTAEDKHRKDMGGWTSWTLRTEEEARHILSSLAAILVRTSAINQAALPGLLGLPELASSKKAEPGQVEAMGVHESLLPVATEGGPWLWWLLTGVLGSAAAGKILDDAALDAIVRMMSVVTEALSRRSQDLLTERLLRFFFPFPPSSSPAAPFVRTSTSTPSHFGIVDPDPPDAATFSIPGFQPLDPSSHRSQGQAVTILLTVLNSLHVDSTIFDSLGLEQDLLPALVNLTLLDAEGPGVVEHRTESTSIASVNDSRAHPPLASEGPAPASWGVALIANKTAKPRFVEDFVAPLLSQLRQRLAAEERKSHSSKESLATATRDVSSVVWLAKALALRCVPKGALEDAISLLIDVAGCTMLEGNEVPEKGKIAEEATPARLVLARRASEGFGLILRDSSLTEGAARECLPSFSSLTTFSCPIPLANQLLTARLNTARVNPLWRQRLYNVSFTRLREAVERHRAHPQAQSAALLALCNMLGSLPPPIIQQDMEPIMRVVLQGMSCVATRGKGEGANDDKDTEEEAAAVLRARATETFVALAKESLDAVMPHLSTVIPLLCKLCTLADPHFLPTARLRVLALGSLLEITRLPYAKLHPYRTSVSRGLLAPLDDRKRVVRQMAVKVRNEWLVMDR